MPSSQFEMVLQSNFHHFVARKHTPTLCQALFVLNTRLDPRDVVKGYEVIEDLVSEPNLSLQNAAWGLLALSKPSNLGASQALAMQLAERLDVRLRDYLSRLVSQSHLYGILALVWSGADVADLHRYEQLLAVHEHDEGVDIQIEDSGDVHLTISSFLDQQNQKSSSSGKFTLLDLGLALLAMVTSNTHLVVGVVERESERLDAAVQAAQKVQGGGIVLGHLENIASNVLILGINLVVGFAFCLYLFGVEFDFSVDWKDLSLRNPDAIFFFIPWAIYILGQLLAIRSGQSALRGMLLLPIFDYLRQPKSLTQGETE